MTVKQIITALSITWFLSLVGIVSGIAMITISTTPAMEQTFNIIGAVFLTVGAVFFGYFGACADKEFRAAQA